MPEEGASDKAESNAFAVFPHSHHWFAYTLRRDVRPHEHLGNAFVIFLEFISCFADPQNNGTVLLKFLLRDDDGVVEALLRSDVLWLRCRLGSLDAALLCNIASPYFAL